VTIKARDFDAVVKKFRFEVDNTHHRRAWLIYGGKTVVKTRRSHGSGDLPMQDAIRQQLKLNENQLAEAISCTLDFDGYIKILQAKGVVEPEKKSPPQNPDTTAS